MMRAAVFTGDSNIEIRECPVPVPGHGEVRIRLEGTGICASNMPVWEGRSWFTYPQPPGAPGHEGWGVIDRVSSPDNEALLGQRVAFLSSRAYAEWDVAAVESIVAIPASLGALPCPGEPLACAVNAFARARIQAGEVVAVVGVGFLGAALISLATHVKARVVAVTRRPFARDLACRLGAELALPLDDGESVVKAVEGMTGGQLADCAIEAAGVQQTLDLAARLTRVRGRLVIAGYHQDGRRDVDMQLWNWRGIDVINAHERDLSTYTDGMRRALAMLERGEWQVRDLITHSAPLEQIESAFEWLRDRPDGFLKAVVRC
jgi:threonine dehydrogenase-like Zn-dependent dehydrogenase